MRVTVIIPTYNYGEYIKESIDSVLSQTFTDFELIIVDDGSTDNTQEILKSISDPRLRTIKIKNSGVSVARNTGLEDASGDYISFLDADDRWLPNKLELQMNMMEEEPGLGLVFTDFARFDEKGRMPRTLFSYVPELKKMKKKQVLGGKGYLIMEDTFGALASVSMSLTWVQTVLLKAKAIRHLRFPVGVRSAQDYNYMLRVYEYVTAGYIDEPLVEVRRHGRNSYKAGEDMLIPVIDALYDIKAQLVKKEHKPILRRRMARAWLGLAYHHFWHGSIFQSAWGYLRALLLPGMRLNALTHLMVIPVIPVLRLARKWKMQ